MRELDHTVRYVPMHGLVYDANHGLHLHDEKITRAIDHRFIVYILMIISLCVIVSWNYYHALKLIVFIKKRDLLFLEREKRMTNIIILATLWR